MYTPNEFAAGELATVHAWMRAAPFATLVTPRPGATRARGGATGDTSEDDVELQATHVPAMLDASEGPYGSLTFHVARANPHVFEGARTLAIFHGPHAYVSPGWYVSGPSVPTWNYVAVHARGTVHRLDDRTHRAAMAALVEHFERGEPKPLQLAMLSTAYRETLLAATVGYRMPIAQLEGKEKLGQNRPEADRVSVVRVLEARGEHAVAAAMKATFAPPRRS